MKLRVGRRVGRTIYQQLGSGPSDNDTLIGVMDTRELAQIVVDAVNGEDDPTIDQLYIPREDLRIEISSTSEPTHPNKSSTIRVTHIPTGMSRHVTTLLREHNMIECQESAIQQLTNEKKVREYYNIKDQENSEIIPNGDLESEVQFNHHGQWIFTFRHIPTQISVEFRSHDNLWDNPPDEFKNETLDALKSLTPIRKYYGWD